MQFNIHTHFSRIVEQEILNTELNVPEAGYFSCGIHPWNVKPASKAALDQLEKALQHPRCLAVGEIGLDRLKGPAMSEQIALFTEQIALAEKVQLPVILHCVKAWNELKDLRKQLKPSTPWIYHGFSKTSILHEVLDEGMFLGIGEAILTNSTLRSAIRQVPLNRIFLETDDATCSIETIYQEIALLKNVTLATVEQEIEIQISKTFPAWTIGLNAPNY